MTAEVEDRISKIQMGMIPSGYKMTRKGIIPVTWAVQPIKNFATVSSGSTPDRKNEDYWNGDIPWVTTGELQSGYIVKTKENVTEQACSKIGLRKYPVGTLLMAMYGQGKTRGTVARLGIEATINQACAAISIKEGNSEFYFYSLQNAYDDIRKMSNTGNQENLNADIIKAFLLLCPSNAEQKKIAQILSLQDIVVKAKEVLLQEKLRQKKFLAQQLLTNRKRLKGFYGEWQYYRLDSIAKRIQQRNNIYNGNVLTISAQYGLISQPVFFNKEIASEDKSNYYYLERDDFAYNKSYSNGYPFGAIKRLTQYDAGIVSPIYICFRINSNLVSVDFLEQYFEASMMNREIHAYAQEGARNHGLLNIAVEDFFNSKIYLPPMEEQIEIAKILKTADREIELLQASIEQEKQKKKALMQLLLSGTVRV